MGIEAQSIKWVVTITLLLIAAAACTTILFVKELKPTSADAFLWVAIWLISPYVVISVVLMFLGRERSASLTFMIVEMPLTPDHESGFSATLDTRRPRRRGR